MALTKKGTVRFQESYGTLQTDKYGLSSATARWHDSAASPTIPTIGTAHPLWTELKLERVNVTHQQTHFEVEASYSGLFGTPEAVYELDASSTEEPIETHPNFATFAGSLGAEVNGAKFNEETGAFEAFVSGTKQGVRGYIAPGAVWRETVVQATAPTDMGSVGSIQAPSGSYPSTPAGRSWMFMGMTYEQRGGAYTVRKEWKLSGRRGWDTDIYA